MKLVVFFSRAEKGAETVRAVQIGRKVLVERGGGFMEGSTQYCKGIGRGGL